MVICFLGDSIVQGIGDAELLGWAGRLARRSIAVDPQRAVSNTYCNLGLRGDSSLRVAARWKDEALRRQRPGEDLAFVFSFGAAVRPQKVARKEALSAAKGMVLEANALGRVLFVGPPEAADGPRLGTVRLDPHKTALDDHAVRGGFVAVPPGRYAVALTRGAKGLVVHLTPAAPEETFEVDFGLLGQTHGDV